MANILQPIESELAEIYSGWDQNKKNIGLGLISPSIYAYDEYRQTKIESIMLGSLSKVMYAGFEHDMMPTVLVCDHVPRYNVIRGFNIRYVPEQIRRAMMKYVIEDNVNRIERNLPMVFDINGIMRAIPEASAILRMYKQQGLRLQPNGVVPLIDWPTVAAEPSPWSNHYRNLM